MARPKIIKAGGGERGQFILREFNDNTVRFVLNYPGIVDVDILRKAIRAVVESVDVLGHGEVEHTLVMYLLADNNLSAAIYKNALDAEEGMIGASPATRLVIYLDTTEDSKLYEIRYLPYGGGGEHIRTCKTLKTYPRQTSTTPEVMKMVMET